MQMWLRWEDAAELWEDWEIKKKKNEAEEDRGHGESLNSPDK